MKGSSVVLPFVQSRDATGMCVVSSGGDRVNVDGNTQSLLPSKDCKVSSLGSDAAVARLSFFRTTLRYEQDANF